MHKFASRPSNWRSITLAAALALLSIATARLNPINHTPAQLNHVRMNERGTFAPGLQNVVIKTNNGVTYWLCAELTPTEIQGGTGTNGPVRNFVHSLNGALGSDQAGHILASQLGGTGTQNWNMFPVDAGVNNGDMKSAETQVKNLVTGRFRNKKLRYYVRLDYNGNSQRPSRIWMAATEATTHFECVWVVNN